MSFRRLNRRYAKWDTISRKGDMLRLSSEVNNVGPRESDKVVRVSFHIITALRMKLMLPASR
jgi:hypothetical protein